MHQRVLRLTLVFLLAACSKTADTSAATPSTTATSGPSVPDGKNPAALVAALDSSTMAAMEQKTGTWQSADAASEWRSRASGGKIRMVDERMTVGETSSRRISHYFTDDGKLAAFIEFRIQTVMASDKSPSQQFVLMKLEFAGDSVSHREKTVDGKAQPIEAYEIDNARKHSMEMLATAQSAASTAPAKP